MNDAFCLQKGIGILLLLERMRFNLIDGGFDFVVQEQILQTFVRKTRHTDRANAPFPVQAFERAPGRVIVAIRFVQQIQVDVVKPEFRQRTIKSSQCVVVFVVLHPQFACHENGFTRQTTFADRLAHFALVEVAGCRVNHAVTDFECLKNRLLRFTFCNLIDSKSNRRHHDTVIQTHFLHLDQFLFLSWFHATIIACYTPEILGIFCCCRKSQIREKISLFVVFQLSHAKRH